MAQSNGCQPSDEEIPRARMGHLSAAESKPHAAVPIDQPADATSAGPTRVEIWFHRVMAGALFLDASGANMVAPFFPAFSRLFHLGQQSIALLLGIRSITAVAMILPVGFAIRHVGHRIVLSLSFTIALVACALLAFPQNWQMLALALFIQGLCTQTVRSGAASFTTSVFARGPTEGAESTSENWSDVDGKDGANGEKGEGKDRATGVHHPDGLKGGNGGQWTVGSDSRAWSSGRLVGALGILYSWTSMGGVVGPVVGSLLYEYTKTWLPFAILGSCFLVLVLVILCFRLPRQGGYKLAQTRHRDDSTELGEANYVKLPKLTQHERPHSYRGLAKLDALALHNDAKWKKRGSDTESDMVDVDLAEAKTDKAVEVRASWTLRTVWSTILRDRTALTVLYIAGIQSMAWGVYEVVVPYFLTERCDFDTAEIGVAFGINNFVYAVVAFWASSFVSHLGSSTSILTGGLLLSVSLPLMTIQGLSCRFPVQYTLNGLNGLGFALIETPLLACLTDVAEGYGMRDYGLLVSIYQLAFASGYALAPFFCAALFTVFLSVGVMGVTSGALVLGLSLWLCAYRRH